MKTIQKYLALQILILMAGSANAQVYTTPNMFFEDWYMVNPSAITMYGDMSVMASSSISTSGIEGAPFAYYLHFRSAIMDNMGGGLRLNRDVRGNFRSTSFTGSYAYHVKIASEHHLNFGLSLGLNTQNFDVVHVDVLHSEDPLLQNGDYRKNTIMDEVGIHYKWKELEAGAVGSYLFQSYNHIMTYAAYTYAIPGVDKLYLKPNVLYQYLPEYVNQLHAALKIEYNMFWAAYSYVTNKDMMIAVGVSYQNFDIGCAYKFSHAEMSRIASFSNQVYLRYNFRRDPGKSQQAPVPWE